MPEKPYRYLKDVSYDELKEELINMCMRLGIPGSAAGYSLYAAVFSEKEKAEEHHKLMEQEKE